MAKKQQNFRLSDQTLRSLDGIGPDRTKAIEKCVKFYMDCHTLGAYSGEGAKYIAPDTNILDVCSPHVVEEFARVFGSGVLFLDEQAFDEIERIKEDG